MIVDYSWARPDPAGLVRQGYQGAMRYLGRDSEDYDDRRQGRDLSRAERDRLHAAGLRIGLVWETRAQRPLDGFAAGATDARLANTYANDLGAPTWVPIFYAVDFGATIGQIHGAVSDYFRGVASVAGRPIACYGPYEVVEHLMNAGLAMCAWQCAGWSGMGQGSGGSVRCLDGSVRRRSRHACMYQDIPERPVHGQDLNHLLLPPVTWAWHPASPTPEHIMEMTMARLYGNHPALNNAQWILVFDGNGHPRRYGIPHPDAGHTLQKAGYDPAVELVGGELNWFVSLPESNAITADVGALSLAMNILARIEALSVQVAGINVEVDLDEEAIVQAVRDFLVSDGVAPAIAEATIEEALRRARELLAEPVSE